MRVHKTGHIIADTVSDLIGELPDGGYKIAYGILRHQLFEQEGHWFEIDKGFWGSNHYAGNYRISYRGTQAKWSPLYPRKPHGLVLDPWRQQSGPNLICPPTSHVCDFFGVDYTSWLNDAMRHGPYIIRHKGDESPVPWDSISKVITFNSTLGIEALRRGIPVISDEKHSSIGSFTSHIKSIDNYNRSDLYELLAAHQFKLSAPGDLCRVIQYYLTEFTSVGTQEKPLRAMSPPTQSSSEQNQTLKSSTSSIVI